MSTEEEQVGEQSPDYIRKIQPDPTWCEHGRGECSCEDDGSTAAERRPGVQRSS